ncbi:MAG: acylneuraminate cytidylyltransferase family protein [Desulfobacterales bacterium]
MIVALIPARGQSKRVPRKNLQKIGPSTLLEWSIASASIVEAIDRIYISSEDDEILNVARMYDQDNFYNRVIPMRRRKHAATDDATDRDVIVDFLNRGVDEGDISLVVYLRPTTPFRRVEDIGEAIQKMIAVPEATGLRSVHEMSESAYKCMTIKAECLLKGIFAMADAVDGANLPNHFYPKTYHPNGVVDIIRPKIVRTGALFGENVMAHITEPTIEIDTLHDLKIAEFEYATRRKEERIVFKP